MYLFNIGFVVDCMGRGIVWDAVGWAGHAFFTGHWFSLRDFGLAWSQLEEVVLLELAEEWPVL